MAEVSLADRRPGLRLGLKRNVEGAYRFLAEHYRPGDQIFLFGFSRGAYAVRVLAAMLRAVGLIDAHQPHLFDYAWTLLTTRMPPRDEDKRAGTRRRGPDFGLLGRFRKVFGRQVKVHFLGLFDTVTSVGWVYDPLTVPYSSNNEMVDVVRQALAIDECRCFFRQNLWFGEKDRKSDVLQVWFPGMHSDVGGGYAPKDSRLALVAFTWMLGEALEAGLHVDPARSRDQLRARSKQGPDPTAPILPVMTRPWRLAEWLPLLVWDRRSGNRAWRWSRGRPRSRPLEPVGQETGSSCTVRCSGGWTNAPTTGRATCQRWNAATSSTIRRCSTATASGWPRSRSEPHADTGDEARLVVVLALGAGQVGAVAVGAVPGHPDVGRELATDLMSAGAGPVRYRQGPNRCRGRDRSCRTG